MTSLLLAADIGGTHARLALARNRSDGGVDIVDQQRFLCAEHPSLAAIVACFLSDRGPVEDAAIGVAGVVHGDSVISRNLPWPVALAELRALGIARVAAVNDFVAVAYAKQCMNDIDTTLLTPGAHDGDTRGPLLIVGPGTGLGAALRVEAGDRILVLPSEPQQLSLAPGNARELALLGHWMRNRVKHVGVGHALSGPGLLNLYRALCALDGVAPCLQSAAEVTSLAIQARDSHAIEAVARFCSLFGSVVGDLVMVTGATRVFLVGGILSALEQPLRESDFAARMTNKDVMRPLLERVPVRLIKDPDLGMIGAASWYQQRR